MFFRDCSSLTFGYDVGFTHQRAGKVVFIPLRCGLMFPALVVLPLLVTSSPCTYYPQLDGAAGEG